MLWVVHTNRKHSSKTKAGYPRLQADVSCHHSAYRPIRISTLAPLPPSPWPPSTFSVQSHHLQRKFNWYWQLSGL